MEVYKKDVNPENFAFAVVSSSSPDLTIQEKWELYLNALKFAKERQLYNLKNPN